MYNTQLSPAPRKEADLQLEAPAIQQLHKRCVRLASAAASIGRQESYLAMLRYIQRQLVAPGQHVLAIHQDAQQACTGISSALCPPEEC